ncbi:MAG TPA: hypothetical protein VGG92_08160, partial [Caulobacteraceae bacterium]
MRCGFIISAICFWAGIGVARADPEVDPIPDLPVQQAPSPGSSVTSHIYAQGDLTLNTTRGTLIVPLPPPASAPAEARTFLDVRMTDAISPQ